MPRRYYNRRRTFRRRRRYGRRRFVRRRSRYQRFPYRKVVNAIERRAELKYTNETAYFAEGTELAANAGGVGIGPTVVYPCVIAEGSGASERLGRRFRIKLLQIRGLIRSHSAHQSTHLVVRIVLGIKKKVEGTAINTDYIFNEDIEDVTSSAQRLSIFSYYDISRCSPNYRILWDQFFVIGGDSHPQRILIDKSFKLNLNTRYNGASAAITAVEQNQLFLLAWTDRTAAENDSPEMRLLFRTRFVDY